MPDAVLIDAIGRQRSKVTLPGYLAGRAPHNKGMRYPADPPRVEEIIAVMRQAGEDRHGLRVRAVIAAAAACSPVTAAGHRDLESICVAGGRWVRASHARSGVPLWSHGHSTNTQRSPLCGGDK